MTLLAQEKMHFQEHMQERVKEIIRYPDYGDMRSVRPHIRAAEMITRRTVFGKDEPGYSEAFWSECFTKTFCIPWFPDAHVQRKRHADFFNTVAELYNDLSEHFFATIKTTAIDARHDGSFGLVFYILQLVIFSLEIPAGQTVAGRLIARSILEAYITLSFLAQKDDSTIWMQYRNYGTGQSKLTYLKNISMDDLPSFTTKELLEELASEDLWLEFQDIKLGAWADRNLRQMSEEAGVKDVYDRYYDGLSGYVHGNWSAVRHAVYGDCLNPLHRFHRVPIPPRILAQDTVPDLVKIANMALDRLNGLYPTFKPRLHLPVADKSAKSEAGSS